MKIPRGGTGAANLSAPRVSSYLIDMAKDPGFIFYPGDYLRDTQCLSEKAQVAYDRIMCEHMRITSTDVSQIVVSKQQLKFFTKRLSPDEIEELMLILEPVGNGYQIEWVALSISKRRKYSESRRQNRSKKPKDIKDISETYVTHMDNENDIENRKKTILDYYNVESRKISIIKNLKANFKLNLNIEQLDGWFDKFLIKVTAEDMLKLPESELMSWFNNWIKTEHNIKPKHGKETTEPVTRYHTGKKDHSTDDPL